MMRWNKLQGRSWWIAVGIGACVCAAFAGGWLHREPPAKIAVATLVRHDMQSTVSTNAQVVPIDDFLARATNGGTVQQILVHLGDHIEPGQLLVIMKDPYAESRVATAVAALRAAQVGVENTKLGGSQEDRIQFGADQKRLQQEIASAERNLATLQSLLQSGAASEAEVHAAQQRLDAANLNLRTLQLRMNDRYRPDEMASWTAKQNEAQEEVKAEKANLGNVKIASTISGTAYLIPVHANDYVAPGAELVHVADLSRLQLRADFDEPDIGKLHVGEPVLIQWEGRPGRVWHGHMERAPLAAMLNGTRHVGESIISIEDLQNDLPPNSTVTATVIVEARRQVLTLPREALHLEGGRSFVYRVKQNHLVKTPIRTGLVTLDRIEVLGGLGPNDQVALHRMDHLDLQPNTYVEVVR